MLAVGLEEEFRILHGRTSNTLELEELGGFIYSYSATALEVKICWVGVPSVGSLVVAEQIFVWLLHRMLAFYDSFWCDAGLTFGRCRELLWGPGFILGSFWHQLSVLGDTLDVEARS